MVAGGHCPPYFLVSYQLSIINYQLSTNLPIS
jgi:hypothetical protein